ncbi:hypothetical protein GF371_04900 [Candidatus Woesearchaeota archaeon]|nr:hypothetical protein [Candidatus Woesearchaeota archaeon]
MDKQIRFLTGKAFFMILLVLTMPLFFCTAMQSVTAVQFAGTIREVKIYGEAGIDQVLDETDTGINVEILVADPDVDPNDVLFQSEPMENCIDTTDPNVKKCVAYFQRPLSEDRIIADVSYGTITLGVPYVIDGNAPRFTSFSVTKSVAEGKLVANFAVTDEVKDTGSCAGVSGIEIATDPDFTDIVEQRSYTPADIDDCMLTDSIELPQPSSSGDYTYYARTYDRLLHLQLGQTVSTLYVDVDLPLISDPVLLYQGAESVYVMPGTRDYELKVEIDENYGLHEVLADLTDFGGQADVNGSCTKVSGLFDCRWDVRPTITDTTSSFSGSIKAVDLEGNSQTKTFTIDVQNDNQAPEISSITTDTNDMIGGYETTVMAAVTDAGVGYKEEDILADFTAVNPSLDSRLPADECVDDVCYWYGVTATREGVKTITIFATDLYGQSESRSESITADITKPMITDVTQSTAYPTASDPTPLVFSINATDENGIETAYLDSTEVSTITDPVEGTCDQGMCVFAVADLITSSTVGDVRFVAVDKAGNPSEILSYAIQVFETDIDTVPNEIGLVVGDPSPQKLDRKIATLTPTKVFVPVTFQHQPLVAVRAKTAVCEGLAPFLVQLGGDNPYFVGAELDDSYLVFDILLDEATSKLDRIDFNCSIYSLVARETTVYSNPEIDNITASIELYNIPVGELGDNVMNKLGDIEKSVDKNWWEWIGYAEQLFEGLRKICKLIDVVKNIYTAVEAMKPIVYAASLALEEISGTGQALWDSFLTLECHIRVAKESLWPNDTQYYYTESGYEQAGGTGDFTILDSLTGGKSVAEGEEDIGGFIRRVCAFVMCNQCNRGFGITGVEKFSTMFDDMIKKATSDSKEGMTPTQKLPTETEEEYRQRLRDNPPAEEEAQPPEQEPEEEDDGKGLFGLGILGLAVSDMEGITGAAADEVSDTGQGKIDLNLLKPVGEQFESHFNPRDNWLVALNCLCLPGLIHNAYKYRQMQCIHARCISDSAKAGFSTAPCDIEHKVKECVFWYGALFEFIPGWLLAEQIARTARDIIRELPGRLISAGRDTLCWEFDQQVKAAEGPYMKVEKLEKCSEVASTSGDLLSGRPLWHIACGAIDLAMLIYSWDKFVENYFNFEDIDFDFSMDDQCKDAFDDYHAARDAAAAAAPPAAAEGSSVPAGAGQMNQTGGGAGYAGGGGGATYT